MTNQTSTQVRTLVITEVIDGRTIETEIEYIAPVSPKEAFLNKAQSQIDELKEFLNACDDAMNELKVLKKLV